jgi:hypothetical protein
MHGPLSQSEHAVGMPTCLYVSSINFFRGDGCTSGGVGFQVPRAFVASPRRASHFTVSAVFRIEQCGFAFFAIVDG